MREGPDGGRPDDGVAPGDLRRDPPDPGAPRPPEPARSLARWLVPDEVAGPLLGDLEEEWAEEVRPRLGPVRAHLWFWWQAVTVRRFALRRAWRRLRTVRPDRESRRPSRAHRPDPDPWSTMSALLRDLRYAVRRLLRTPGFTAVAVLSLALGIGANTAIFSVVNAVLFRELPLEEPERLVELYTSDSGGALYATSSHPDYLDLRREMDVFENVVGTRTFLARMDRGGEPELAFGELVSWDYFQELGVEMALGRSFLPEEDATPGTHPVVVLGHRTWTESFGADPGVLGTSLVLNGRAYTVVGVAPRAFSGSLPVLSTGFYVPLMMTNELMAWDSGDTDHLGARGNRSMFLKARLAPGVSVEQANRELEAFAVGIAEAHPETNEDRVYTAVPTGQVSLHPFIDRMLRPVAALLLAVVGLVLLIACVNLASFLLARAEERRREIAVRLALGAGRGALVRQLLVETTLLAFLGGGAGLLAAGWTLGLLRTFQPPVPVPVDLVVELDGTVLAFTAGVSLLAGLLFGLLPALQATRPDVAPTLKSESTGAAGSRSRLRSVLVTAQVAFSFLLLIGAGLFARSLQKAQAIDPGFDTGPAALVWPMPEMSGYTTPDALRGFYQTVRTRLLADPEIDVVAMADRLPLGSNVQSRGYVVPGTPSERPGGWWSVDNATVMPGYFEAMGIPLLRGRPFGEADLDGEPLAVVSEAFARRFFPGEEAVGRAVSYPGGGEIRIVGVAADTKVRTLGEEPRPFVYEVYRPVSGIGLQVVARGRASSPELLAATRRVLDEVDPDLVLFEAKTMNEHLALMLFPPRMAALLLAVFGALALLLSAVGIYGVVSHAVATRTRELGIRMSLGASAADVVRMAVGGGMRLVLVGGAVGVVLAGGVTWLVSGFLYGISARDVTTFAAIPVVLGAVALLAAWVPARRAAAVDPVTALRSE